LLGHLLIRGLSTVEFWATTCTGCL
jgi:hypothetical protein